MIYVKSVRDCVGIRDEWRFHDPGISAERFICFGEEREDTFKPLSRGILREPLNIFGIPSTTKASKSSLL
jgi:hypothetical protein